MAAAVGTFAGAAFTPVSKLFSHSLSRVRALPLFKGKAYDPTTLFLTWQRDPTTTMTIQWIAPATHADTTIRYAPLNTPQLAQQKSVTKPYPHTSLSVHRCELVGLKPDTEYRFQIGYGSPSYRFRTMPQKATNTIRFVSGGDSGTNEHAVANNILAAKQDPHFIFLGGDLAYDSGRSPDTFTRFLQNYRTHMVDSSGRMIPLVSCIGNHEVTGGYNRNRADGPQYFSVFDGLYQDRTYNVLDFGDYLSLVMLDTGHVSPIAGEQTDWLRKTLAEREDRQHLIAANHVPAYPSHRRYVKRSPFDHVVGEDQRKYWCPLFERYKVDAVLEHHDHTFKRTFPLIDGQKDKNGVTYLGDGSWGKVRPLNAPEERPYLAASAESYHLSVHDFEGTQQIHTALKEGGKVADRCIIPDKRPSRRG